MKFDILKKAGTAVKAGLKKASPDICFWGGMALTVTGAVVLAIRSTQLMEAVEDHKSEINEAHELEEDMEPKKYKKELAKCYWRMGKDIVSLYALPVTMVGCGCAAMGCMHIKLKKENAMLLGSVAALSKSLDGIRKQIAEELGDDKAYDILNGIKEEEHEVEIEDAKGNKKKDIAVDRSVANSANNPFAITFEEATCGNATNDPAYNKMFLRRVEQNLQWDLDHGKPVFINDICAILDHKQCRLFHDWGFLPGDIVKLGFDDPRNPGAQAFMDEDCPGVMLTMMGKGGTMPHYIADDAFNYI